MEAITTHLGENLKRLRGIKGLTQEELAKTAGLSRNAYRNIERGDAEPRYKNLQRIASALDVNVFHLMKVPPKVSSLRFRANKTLSAKDRNQRAQHIIDFARWLNDFNSLQKQLKVIQPFILASLVKSTDNPVEMAAKARKALELNEHEPIWDICDLVESAGLKVFTLNSNLKSFFGFCLSEDDGGPAIGVNHADGVSVERKIFTVAHELGHILMHPQSFHDADVQENPCEEKDADAFASHLLMPQAGFEHELKKSRGLHWVNRVLHIKRIFKVSYKTVIYRLIEMKLASSPEVWQRFNLDHKRLYGGNLKNHFEPRSLAQKEFGAVEPNKLDSFDFMESRLHSLVRQAVEQELITTQRAAEILGITLNEMRELVLAWSTV